MLVFASIYFGAGKYQKLERYQKTRVYKDQLNTMETLKEIVRGTTARLSHVCNGRVIYQIQTTQHMYQLELDSTSDEWTNTYLLPEFKSISLMRWIRKGMESGDGSFILLL